MIDTIASITGNTSIIPLKSAPDPSSFGQVTQAIQKAKAMMSAKMSRRKEADPHSVNISQATNLLQMAETALKNGNQFSANEFAQKVLRMVLPGSERLPFPESKALVPGNEEQGSEKKKKASPPLPEPGAKKTDMPENKKHTEHTYKDASNDAGVSFTFPGKLTGPQSFIAVPAHEMEHVGRSISEAVLNGDQVQVFVSYRMRFDPVTGEAFLAGGTTTTIRKPHMHSEKGKHIDAYA